MAIRLTVEVTTHAIMLVVRVSRGGSLVALVERTINHDFNLDLTWHALAYRCSDRECTNFVLFFVLTMSG